MEQDISVFTQKEFQRAIVAHILRTKEFLVKLYEDRITQKDFNNPVHRAIVQAAKAITDTRGGINPDICIQMNTLGIQVKSMLAAGIILKEEIGPLAEEVDLMYEMELDVEYYLGLLADYLSEVRIGALLKAAKRKNKNNTEIGQEIALTLSDISKETNSGEVVQPLMDCLVRTTPVISVPTMINVIDAHMKGGLGLGEFGVICGITGLGKTTLAVNFCWGAAKLGFPCALVTLELTKEKIAERLYSRITGIPYDRIRLGDGGCMDEVKRDVQAALDLEDEDVKRRLDIWDFSDEGMSLDQLDNKLSDLNRKNEAPKMIFVDWLDIIQVGESARKKGEILKELRHKLGYISSRLADIAKKYNIAVWATTQANKLAEDEAKVRMSNASEGFGKSFKCSCYLGIGASKEDKEENRLCVTASKMRDGETFSAYIYADMSVQLFTDAPVQSDEIANFEELGV
jgi:replicative DNA helicase